MSYGIAGFGWFADIFDVSLELNAPHFEKTIMGSSRALFESTGVIQGTATIKPPSKASVWQYGVKIRLESSLSLFDTLTTYNSIHHEKVILEEGYITEEVKIKFDIDLSKLSSVSDAVLPESYAGNLFSLSYGVSVIIERPWYTFNVESSEFLTIQFVEKVKELVSVENLQELRISKGIANSEVKAPISKTLVVEDGPYMTWLELDKLVYNVNESIEYKLSVKKPKEAENFKDLKVVLYKIEAADGEENEIVLLEHSCVKVLETEGVESGESISYTMSGNIDLNASSNGWFTDFCPSFVELYPETQDNVSVRFFLRLVLEDSNENGFWNTNEIILVRSGLSPFRAKGLLSVPESGGENNDGPPKTETGEVTIV